MERFYVTVWHGESGSLGWLVDRDTGEYLLYTSTIRDGGEWRSKLDDEARRLNSAS